MFLPGAEQAGLRLWRRWVLAGRRDEAEPCPDGPGWTLAYTGRYRLTFLLTTALFAGVLLGAFATGAFEERPAWEPWVLGGISVAITALQVYLVAASFLDRVTVSERGVVLKRLLRGRMELPWADLDRVFPNGEGDGLVFLRRDGAKGEVSRFLNGLVRLRMLMQAHLPGPRWESASPFLP
ncbi:MAG: hypothetical protein AB1347_09290 [Acidobacteriota bacterium]